MSRIAQLAPTAARLLLGLIFFVFGLNGFLHFLPMPPPEGVAGTFMGGLAATGYFFPLLKGTEVLAGLLLLGNRFVPLALIVLAPIVVQIAAFHLFLAPASLAMAGFLVVAEAYLAWTHRVAFQGVLAATPAAARGERRAPSLAGAAVAQR